MRNINKNSPLHYLSYTVSLLHRPFHRKKKCLLQYINAAVNLLVAVHVEYFIYLFFKKR